MDLYKAQVAVEETLLELQTLLSLQHNSGDTFRTW